MSTQKPNLVNEVAEIMSLSAGDKGVLEQYYHQILEGEETPDSVRIEEAVRNCKDILGEASLEVILAALVLTNVHRA